MYVCDENMSPWHNPGRVVFRSQVVTNKMVIAAVRRNDLSWQVLVGVLGLVYK